MRLNFNLEYRTEYGEELMLNILPKTVNGKTEQRRMLTTNGSNWTCEVSMDVVASSRVEYYYTVSKNGNRLRGEWLVEPHLVEMNVANGNVYEIYDHWVDIPEDAYMYSSAFTDCVSARERHAEGKLDYDKAVCIKVRAPQLRQGERLAIIGSDAQLGGWSAFNAVAMSEQAPNEWVVTIDAEKLTSRHLEFKFVSIGGDGVEDVMWETNDNRTLQLPDMTRGGVIVYELPRVYFAISQWRGAGAVVPVFSLRSEGSFGVGDFGDLKQMIDWVDKTNQRVLQILPINDTNITHTWTDSYPYNSISIYALHPQYTDLRQLPELKSKERRDHYAALQKELNALSQIDYERVNKAKMDYLHELFEQEWTMISRRITYKRFFETNKEWLVPYAAFCYYRDIYGTAEFKHWPDHRQLTDEERETMAKPTSKEHKDLAFWFFVQYNLDTQMRAAHDYARSKRVILKGDIPIGISRAGVEAWVEPRYFNMNGQAGAPPDAFSVNGQNWGFPTYNWDEMLKDGCSWWVRRFRKMAEYFDAYRIDHVLGFFRIWEIPENAVHGLLGQFSPSLGMTREEIGAYGLNFQEERFTRPFIADWTLNRIFKERAAEVRDKYLVHTHDDMYDMKPEYDTQRKIEAAFQGKTDYTDVHLRDGLYALVSDVLFVRDRSDRNKFHPRIGVQNDFIYESLYDSDKAIFNKLYNDYFYRRNNQFWYNESMKKLPLLTQATRMLVCAEDLGMVPECVPWVINELRILSLEIQSMPKDNTVRFGHLSQNPYRSVCTISTHDMPTLRQWWDEDAVRTREYYNTMLYREGDAPHPLPDWLAKDIVSRNLMCPSMLCLLSLQDWLSIDGHLRLADEDAERINIPANPRHYWRYRMHLSIKQLMAADEFNAAIKELVADSDRK